MLKTKTAWKVVSDPYAPEAQWAPACAEPITGEVPLHIFRAYTQSKAKSTGQKVAEATILSLGIALLGGAFAGQSVHVNYYAQHVFAQLFFGDHLFETWGTFYYWYNQANALCTYIPIFFAYSMGFWSSVNGLGRKFGGLCAGLCAAYFIFVHSMHLVFPFVQEKDSYTTLLMAIGAVGSALAFFLGKTIAKNVAAIVNPRLIFISLIYIFVPMMFSCLPVMSNFGFVAAVNVLSAILLGLYIRGMHRGSLKTSILLSLSAASPLVLCGLLHVPVAGWFETLDSQASGLLFFFSRDLFYYVSLPLAALTLPVFGTVAGHWLGLNALRSPESLSASLTGMEPYALPDVHSSD